MLFSTNPLEKGQEGAHQNRNLTFNERLNHEFRICYCPHMLRARLPLCWSLWVVVLVLPAASNLFKYINGLVGPPRYVQKSCTHEPRNMA